MKTQVSVLALLIGTMATSMAFAGEAKECWFGGHGKEDIRCKVRLMEENDVKSSSLDSLPVSVPDSRCEKVKMYVDCNCDFELNDEYATQFDKHGDEINVATQYDKLAALVIKEEALLTNGEGQQAVLTISEGYGKDAWAHRLVGHCKSED